MYYRPPSLDAFATSLRDAGTNYGTVKVLLRNKFTLKDENVFEMSSVMGNLGEILTIQLRLAIIKRETQEKKVGFCRYYA